MQSNIVHLGSRAILRRARHRDLELTRQVGKFRVVGGPLPNDFAVRTGIIDLVLGDTGHVVGGDIADAITAGLNRVHLHRGQVLENVGNFFQLWPVELQVRTGGEVTHPAVIATSYLAKLAKLA